MTSPTFLNDYLKYFVYKKLVRCLLKLLFVQRFVMPIFSNKLIMCAFLHNFARFKHNNVVGIFGRRNSVAYNNCGSIFCDFFQII